MALFTVPHELYATEEQSRPVNGDLIVFFECRLEVLEVGYVHYFYAEVINNEAKSDGPPRDATVPACVGTDNTPGCIVVVPTACLPESQPGGNRTSLS